MATIRGTSDSQLEVLKAALDRYEGDNPDAEATLFREAPAAIRVRIIDRRFEGMTKVRRHNSVWSFLTGHVPEDVLVDISQLVLVPTTELRTSFANLDFDDPVSSHV